MSTASTTTTNINDRAADEYFRKARDAEAGANLDRAIEFYERALGENPDHEAASFQLALIYDRRGEDAKAIDLYERICAGDPVHLNALVNLSVLYEDNNMYDEARQCLEVVLATKPDDERAKLYLKDVQSARLMFVGDEELSGDDAGMMEHPIIDFDLSVRSRNALKKMNVRTLGDLLKVSEQELLSFKNFGETSLNEIKSLLASRGLRLGQGAVPSAGGGHSLHVGDGMGGHVGSGPGGATSVGPLTLGTAAPAMPRRAAHVGGDVSDEVLSKSVGDMDLSVRSRKALQRLNINTVGELASRTEEELLGCKNFGQTSLNELRSQLATFGLQFRKLAN